MRDGSVIEKYVAQVLCYLVARWQHEPQAIGRLIDVWENTADDVGNE